MSNDNRPTVICQNGRFIGKREESGVLAFLGIPYAKPPVGPRRWKAPESPASSEDVFAADAFGKSAVQTPWFSEPATQNPAGMSEDCLTLNVWTKHLESSGKPVMVWIHGGAFAWGGTCNPRYSGESIVKHHDDVIVASITYRLGMYGQLDLSRVPGGKDFPDSKNLAFLDLIKGLEWIQDNIRSFGGDPDNVTIFGESAGSAYVSLLLACNRACGLFRRAICESGTPAFTYNQNEFDRTGTTAALLQLTGAKNMDDLMAIPEAELARIYMEEEIDEEGNTINDLFNGPFRGDRDLVAADPYQAIADGAGKDVDLLIGSNADEWRYWISEIGTAPLSERSDEEIQKGLSIYGATVAAGKKAAAYDAISEEDKAILNRFYKLDRIRSMEEMWQDTELGNELAFRIPSIETASCHADAGGKTYMYYFNIPSIVYPYAGACHLMEVPYVFHNADQTVFGEPLDEALADQICTAWVNFAKTGDPSTDTVSWTPYDTADRNTLVMTRDGFRMVSDPLGEERQLLQKLARYFIK